MAALGEVDEAMWVAEVALPDSVNAISADRGLERRMWRAGECESATCSGERGAAVGGMITDRAGEGSARAAIVVGGTGSISTTDRSNGLVTKPSTSAPAENHQKKTTNCQSRSWITIVENRPMPFSPT
jgi:hypothetical protein